MSAAAASEPIDVDEAPDIISEHTQTHETLKATNAESTNSDHIAENPGAASHVRTRPLSVRQERKLVTYLDDKMLDLMRNFKKRTHPSSTLPNLSSYLEAFLPLLSLILQIPPTSPNQSSLRTALLLRLTGDLLSSIPGYEPRTAVLKELLEVLDLLDRGWTTVLRAQAWDMERGEGVDVEFEVEEQGQGGNGTSTSELSLPAPVSLTERARLRSLLLAGTEGLEEWLEKLRDQKPANNANGTRSTNGVADGDAANGTQQQDAHQDLESMLELLDLEQAFDSLFERTLSEMGELGGGVLNAEGEVAMS